MLVSLPVRAKAAGEADRSRPAAGSLRKEARTVAGIGGRRSLARMVGDLGTAKAEAEEEEAAGQRRTPAAVLVAAGGVASSRMAVVGVGVGAGAGPVSRYTAVRTVGEVDSRAAAERGSADFAADRQVSRAVVAGAEQPRAPGSSKKMRDRVIWGRSSPLETWLWAVSQVFILPGPDAIK